MPPLMIATCEICGKSCGKYTTKSGKNIGREFFKCQDSCNFFMWVDQLHLCRCGKGQCKVRTATKGPNKGQYFLCCPNSTGVIYFYD